MLIVIEAMDVDELARGECIARKERDLGWSAERFLVFSNRIEEYKFC